MAMSLSEEPILEEVSQPQELCYFLERLLEEHHARLLREVDARLSDLLGSESGRRPPSSCSEPLHFSEGFAGSEGGGAVLFPGSFRPASTAESRGGGSARPSYGNMQEEKKQSAREVRFKSRISARRAARRQLSRQQKLSGWVHSTAFELASCLLIVTNAVFFGLEVELTAANPEDEALDRALWTVGQAFTAVFALEILLRAFVDPRSFLTQSPFWNLFDVSIVLAGLLELALSFAGVETKTNLTHVRIIRVARTVRMLKVVRLLAAFASLRILVNSVLNTMRSLLWTLALLFVVLFLFGLLFTNATVEHLREGGGPAAPQLTLYYGGLFRSMYTLFQAITAGINWSVVAKPLGVLHPAWEATLMLFISFTYFAMLNVVTGVFCQSAIESANQDKDTVVQAQLAMEKLYTDQLQRIFSQIDEENMGFITLNMFEESLQDDQVKAYFDGLDLTTDDAWNLFKLLDSNESNCIDLGEFVAGCLRLRGRARSVDVHMLLHQSHWTMKRLGDVLEQLASKEATPREEPAKEKLLQRLTAVRRSHLAMRPGRHEL